MKKNETPTPIVGCYNRSFARNTGKCSFVIIIKKAFFQAFFADLLSRCVQMQHAAPIIFWVNNGWDSGRGSRASFSRSFIFFVSDQTQTEACSFVIQMIKRLFPHFFSLWKYALHLAAFLKASHKHFNAHFLSLLWANFNSTLGINQNRKQERMKWKLALGLFCH